MDEAQLILIGVCFLISLFIGVYAWLYARKVYHINTHLQIDIPPHMVTLLHASFLLASFTLVLSGLFFIIVML